MKKSNFSEMCMATSALCLIFGLVGGVIAWFVYSAFSLFLTFAIPGFILFVLFGSISEHLQRMAWIVEKMGYEEQHEIK